MNYAIVVSAGVWVFAAGYYYFPKIGGKTFFVGPRTEDLSAEVHDYYEHTFGDDPNKINANVTTVPVEARDQDSGEEITK